MIRLRARRLLLAALAPIAAAIVATPAAAEPYRLRGDALASAQAPGGLLTLEADGQVDELVHAEALVWLGAAGLADGFTDGQGAQGDALVIAIEAHDRKRRVSGTAGRFVAVTGALRPVHVDGIAARARLPYRVTAEVFGGVPVQPELGAQSWDWVAGSRVARRLGDWGSVGAAYLQRREAGRRSVEELGFDAGGALGKASDAGGRLALDLIHGGIAELEVSAASRRGALRGEVFAGQRSSGRLLPATSLFSVLGDVPSRHGGASVRWRAAPRLDVRGTAALRVVGPLSSQPARAVPYDDVELGADLRVGADLRLDDKGRGSVGVELHREGAPDGGWTGARATARVPAPHDLTISAELELVVPDDPKMGTGTVWPWALLAAGWKHGPWEIAAAVEASASALESSRVDALVRVGRAWTLGGGS